MITETMTPAEVAKAALDGIEAERAAFNMSSWAHQENGQGLVHLAPHQSPLSCGTTLCAAGMIAHMLGWTITSGGTASKDDYVSHVSGVAEKALGISPNEGNLIWYASEGEAIYQLQRIADGKPSVFRDED